MNFRGWFDRLPPDRQAVATTAMTVLAWLLVAAVIAIVAALMGFAWWR